VSESKTDTRLRVFRGGGWDDRDPSRVRVAFRNRIGPTLRDSSLGFRCALRGREPRA
jgi:formylglycine-generating enzyme required for sulfatase activity